MFVTALLVDWMILSRTIAFCDHDVFPSNQLASTNKYDQDDDYYDPNDMNMCLFSISDVGYDTQLSNNFWVNEFVCADGSDGFRLSPALIQCLQSVRTHLNAAITVNSAYRTVSHNMNIGGAQKSMHLSGTAADITTASVSMLAFAEFIVCDCANVFQSEGNAIGLGLASSYIHVDMRRDFASWIYDGAALSAETWKEFIQNTTNGCNNSSSSSRSIVRQFVFCIIVLFWICAI